LGGRAAVLAGIDPRRLVFLDGSGIDARMVRSCARAPRGQRAVGKVPHGRWERLTVLGALAVDGVAAAMSIAAAASTAVFLAFTEQVLVPAMRGRPDAILVMDNLAGPRAETVRGALDRAGLSHRCLPPCSRDLNPIEPSTAPLSRVQAQGSLAGDRRPLARGARRGTRPGAGRHHRQGCPRMVPSRRPPSRLTDPQTALATA
jgi:hypothetical protein